MRAVELFEQGRPQSEVARSVGMHPESVRRWKRLWEQGGADALRRRPATGRPPKLDDSRVELVRAALEHGAQAHGYEADLWTLERAGVVVELATEVKLARASVWRLLTGRLGWSLQRTRRQALEPDECEIIRWVAQEWPRIKARELANLAGDHIADVADAAEHGIRRICSNEQLPWPFLTHTGLTIHPEPPQN